MFYSRIFESLWGMLRAYTNSSFVVDENKSRFHKSAFRYYSAGGPRGGKDRGTRSPSSYRDRLNMLSYKFDPDAVSVYQRVSIILY